MPYTAEISRKNPSCFIFLIDQSGSMEDGWSGERSRKKSDELATIINRLLQNLVIKCSKSEGVRDYFHVGVINYGKDVGSAFGGQLIGKELLTISSIANNPLRIEERQKKVDDGAGGLVDQVIKLPIWFDSIASGGTPMCQALTQTQTIVQNYVNQYPSCFPPIVFNLTDGEATDGDPALAAETLKAVSSTDGNVLLFNIHISSHKAESSIEFPDKEDGLPPDKFAQRLFRMSSILPEHIQNAAKSEGYQISESSRGFAFNSDIVTVIRILDIGTRPTNLR